MAIRRLLLAATLAAIALATVAAATEDEAAMDVAAGDVAAEAPPPAGLEPARDFYYTLGEDGEPIFTQVLRWEADPDALEFEVLVEAPGGRAILDEKVSEAALEVHLPPGSYRYKIVTYNLLGRAELETDWVALEVIKAEQPILASLEPAIIYMDSLDPRITLRGDKLLPGGVARLIPKGGGAPITGQVAKRDDEASLVVVFPDEAYEPGEYSLSYENPGGLVSTLEGALRIRFQRPLDLLVGLGYSPLFPLGDAWLAENWPSAFDALGFSAKIEAFFIKQRWGYLGLEAAGEWQRLYGGEEKAVITSDYLLWTLSASYKYRFTRLLHGIARAGGGLAVSYHSFDYEGFQGPTATSADPCATLGLALQAFLPSKFYGEIGLDGVGVFLLNHYALGLMPRISVGYQLY
jgi:hypothetical protein